VELKKKQNKEVQILKKKLKSQADALEVLRQQQLSELL
jgi:hypothetical protein